MIKMFKTLDGQIRQIERLEPGSWISVTAPTEAEKEYLIREIGITPEFVQASLDEEESSHIDYDDESDQTLVIIDCPCTEKSDVNYGNITLQYSTMPLAIISMKGYISTISLYENISIQDMENGKVKGVRTELRTRFLLILLFRISQRYLVCLREIDRLSSFTEKKLHKSMQNKELIQMLGLEKSWYTFLHL